MRARTISRALAALAVAFVAASLFEPKNANASTFDATAGVLKLDPSASFKASLDSPAGLSGLPSRVFAVTRRSGYASFADSSETVDAKAFAAEKDAVEGHGALRVAGDRALLLGDEASLAPFAGGRIEITAFVRADGAPPELRAIYGRKPLDVQTAAFPTGEVVAVRTGRATSDGWIELSTGPIDGTVAGAAIRGLVLVGAGDSPDGASFLVDALEIHAATGPLLSGGDCYVAHEAEQCKKGAVCMEGVCVDSAVAYAALPPADTRKDIVARTSAYLTRFQDDRHASAAATEGFAKEMPAIAASADTPAAFYRSYAASFGRVRGAHTFAPGPNPWGRLAIGATDLVRRSGSELEACFGVVDKDLSGGGRGYGVYATAGSSPLHVGDVVDTIDGEAPDAWLARVAAQRSLLAADPDSDRAFAASDLHAIMMRFARDLVIQRCSGVGACESVTIALQPLRKAATAVAPLTCSPRFKLAVDVPSGVDSNAYEAAIAQTGTDGIVSLHTNGEPLSDSNWVNTVKGAFESGTDRLIIDKRRGDGGGGDALQTWAGYMRRGLSYGLFTVSRIDFAQIDGAPGFLDKVLGCSGSSFNGNCIFATFESFPSKPGALPAKVAWLNVLDGSASDMATYFAKGATGVRIFAPNRTMGLFGGLGIMGAFLPGWGGGSVQIGDTREGATADERRAGFFRSGHGIDPDEIVVQTQSDLLAGKDTMLERARAWLGQ
jgi:hypothetical protein